MAQNNPYAGSPTTYSPDPIVGPSLSNTVKKMSGGPALNAENFFTLVIPGSPPTGTVEPRLHLFTEDATPATTAFTIKLYGHPTQGLGAQELGEIKGLAGAFTALDLAPGRFASQESADTFDPSYHRYSWRVTNYGDWDEDTLFSLGVTYQSL